MFGDIGLDVDVGARQTAGVTDVKEQLRACCGSGLHTEPIGFVKSSKELPFGFSASRGLGRFSLSHAWLTVWLIPSTGFPQISAG